MRKARGNMIVLSGAFLTVNALGLVIASSFGSLFFVHNRLQTTADELALQGARILNEQDRIGQMNNMTARSRQLVYDAGEAGQDVQANMNHLSDLSDRLREEARSGAILLEQERVKLLSVSKTEATNAMMARFNEIKSGQGLQLPWLQAATPSTPVISFGYTNSVHSNVCVLSGIDTLQTSDQGQGLLSSDGSKLYKENIDARLNGSDSDLHFRISSLAAPVNTSVSPARATLAKNFRNSPPEHICSTVLVKLHMQIGTGLGASTESVMEAAGCATATGGEPML